MTHDNLCLEVEQMVESMKKGRWIEVFLLLVFVFLLFPRGSSADTHWEFPSRGRHPSYEKIDRLSITAGADENLFVEPKKFPVLKKVGLFYCPRRAPKYLVDLSSNYSNLTSIGIVQEEPLDSKSVALLKRFSSLIDLNVDFPSELPAQLWASFPDSLTEVFVGPNSNLLSIDGPIIELPRLEKLDIRGTKLSTNFLSRLRCRKLRLLMLTNVELDVGIETSMIQAFPNLKRVNVFNSNLGTDAALSLRSHKIKIEFE